MKTIYGFTNNKADLERAVSFREQAIADGWEVQPTYPKHESISSYATLKKNGFHMSILSRINGEKSTWKYEANVHIWGPDMLAIRVPEKYDMTLIMKGLRICDICNQDDVDTQRVAFANRVCKECLPYAKKMYETPGWDN